MQRFIQIASVKAVTHPGEPVVATKETTVSVTDTFSGLEWADILELCPVSPTTEKRVQDKKRKAGEVGPMLLASVCKDAYPISCCTSCPRHAHASLMIPLHVLAWVCALEWY